MGDRNSVVRGNSTGRAGIAVFRKGGIGWGKGSRVCSQRARVIDSLDSWSSLLEAQVGPTGHPRGSRVANADIEAPLRLELRRMRAGGTGEPGLSVVLPCLLRAGAGREDVGPDCEARRRADASRDVEEVGLRVLGRPRPRRLRPVHRLSAGDAPLPRAVQGAAVVTVGRGVAPSPYDARGRTDLS